ncbi:hypothetical protein QE152_g13629 [Popillia japonica]|uniref:Uncharacterized protein n=1 Tax=Popillia japonica TaxID=7064 RepID=A0AAW1LD04_POPJA
MHLLAELNILELPPTKQNCDIREALCRACGITVSITMFTSAISQKLADRAGFKDLYAIDYADLEKINPIFRYPGIQEHTKSIRCMYIIYK